MKKTSLIILLLSVFCFVTLAQDADKKPSFCKDSIKVLDIEVFKYVAYEQTGSYTKIGAAGTKLWEEGVKQFLDVDRSSFVIYYNSPQTTAEKDLKWEIARKLKSDDDIYEPLVKKEWTYKKVAKVIYNGPLGDELGQAYGALMEWINENNYRIAGPALEKYLKRPRKNKDGVMTAKIEIWMPVMASK